MCVLVPRATSLTRNDSDYIPRSFSDFSLQPGRTNSFLIRTRAPLALRYLDDSPLERHHASVGLSLLEKHRILATLEPGERSEVCASFVSAILATDMSQHASLLSRLRARVAAEKAAVVRAARGLAAAAPDAAPAPSAAAGPTAPAHGLAAGSVEDRRLLVAYLLHAADLHTPLLPHPLSRRVAASLDVEFAAQAFSERALGLSVSVMLPSSAAAKARNELGFLRAVVKPLYATLAELAPPLRPCIARVDANERAWAAAVGGEP